MTLWGRPPSAVREGEAERDLYRRKRYHPAAPTAMTQPETFPSVKFFICTPFASIFLDSEHHINALFIRFNNPSRVSTQRAIWAVMAIGPQSSIKSALSRPNQRRISLRREGASL
jgi:hypothetical protein